MLSKLKRIVKKVDECAYIWLPALLLIVVFYPVSLLAIPITFIIVYSKHISMSNKQRIDQDEYQKYT